MTQAEKLDKILQYLAKSLHSHSNETIPFSGYKIIDLCLSLKIPIGADEHNKLENILILDGYIKYVGLIQNHIITITNDGLRFINTNSYKQIAERNQFKRTKDKAELELLKSNIKTNKWSKIVSVISIIIAIISLFVSIFS